MTAYDILRQDVAAMIDNLLFGEQIWSVHDVAWKNEWDPNPDFIGHAMWQLDGPKIDLASLDAGGRMGANRGQERTKHALLDPVDKELAVVGEDFVGLMDAARLSIGYALFWYPRDVAETLGTAQVASFFWSHRVDAYVKLSMASDRLRDFLIMAATRGPRRTFKNRYEDSGSKSAADMPWKWYATPFTSIVELLGEKVTFVQQRCASAINAVREAGCPIRAYKKDRNIVVHELATKMAEVTRELHVMAEKRAVEGEKPNITSTVSDIHEMSIDIKCAGIRAMREFAEATGTLKDWYALLLATSHHVFQIDYHTRIHDGSGN